MKKLRLCLVLGIVACSGFLLAAGDDDDCDRLLALAAERGGTMVTRTVADTATSAPSDEVRQRRRQQRLKRQQRMAAAAQPAASRPADAQPKKDEPMGEAIPEGNGPVGTRLTGTQLYDTQPCVMARPQGGNWLTWVGYQPGGGDYLLVAVQRDGKLEHVQQLTKEAGDLFRPVMTSAGEKSMLLFTRTDAGQGPRIYFSELQGDSWGEPKVVPNQPPHTMNAEAVGLPDGSIVMVYQRFQDGVYGIGLRTFKEGKWSDERMVQAGARKHGEIANDSWDPVLAWDRGTQKLFIAWVSYFGGEYDLCWSTVADGQISTPQRVVRAGYDLHPSVLSDPEAGVWLAWDSITIPNHGGSGATFIKHPNHQDVTPRGQKQVFYVAAAKWTNGQLTAPGGQARVSGEKEDTHHGGMPKLAFDGSGHLYIAYRTLHEPVSGRTMYYWDITTRTLSGNEWTKPVRLAESDGPTEEPSLVADGSSNMLVFFQRDYRRTKTSNDGNQVPRLANAMLVAHFDHHEDYGDPKLRHGDVYVTRIPSGESSRPEAKGDFHQDPIADKPLKQFEPYHKDGYTVLFGDLHRHSNVSRCSRGFEPDPDDHYRYSRDICRYDFLGISDHAAHTSDYNWWRLEKLADLYYTPGDFTTLFGVEWNCPGDGHKNVMSPRRDLPLLAVTGQAPSAEALWAALDKWGGPAITIPHSSSLPGQSCDWSKHNDKYQRLVEIFQACRGSFEGEGAPRLFSQATLKKQHVQNALAMKYRLGIICSNDHGYGASYACVYAKENTREAIFDALYDRRTYGSTTYGVIVDFNVNGVMMGRDVKRGDGVVATGYVRGADKLDKVQILKDNEVIKEWQPDGTEFKVDWKDPSPGDGIHWYYLRVIQENDEMAWSSPSWVVD